MSRKSTLFNMVYFKKLSSLILSIFLLLQSCAFPIQLGEVVALQHDYEAKAQSVLNRYFGPDQVLVNVIVFTKNSNITTMSNVNEQSQLKNQPLREERSASTNNLPGYSVLAAQSQHVYDTVSQVNKTSQQTSVEKDISRIEATLVVPVKFKVTDVQQAQQIVSTVLKLDPTRGDKLTVMKLDFKDSKNADLPFAKRFAQTVQSNDFIKIYVVYAFILVIVIIFAIAFLSGILIISNRLKQGIVSKQESTIDQVNTNTNSNAKSQTSQETEGEATTDDFMDVFNPTTQAERTTGGVSKKMLLTKDGDQAEGSYLASLPIDQLGKLVYLLKNEPIEKQVTVFNYLRPELGARLLELFPLETQKAIILSLSQERKLTPKDVQLFIKDIEKQLDYTLGGRAFTSQIFDFVDVETTQNILEEVRKDDAQLADEISKSIYVFSDLKYVERGVIASIIRSVGVKDFSIAASDETDEFRAAIYESVSEGVGDLIKQSLSLLRRQPRSKVAEAKQKVVMLLKRLNKEGIVPDKGQLGKQPSSTESPPIA